MGWKEEDAGLVHTHTHSKLSLLIPSWPSPPRQAFHSAGLVHRDIKPLNIIFSETDRRFKLIDLGACADLRTGMRGGEKLSLNPRFCLALYDRAPENLCIRLTHLTPTTRSPRSPNAGQNYVPDEGILDRQYAPPEKYILPTDSPHLSKSVFNRAMSPVLWARHRPDHFDQVRCGGGSVVEERG